MVSMLQHLMQNSSISMTDQDKQKIMGLMIEIEAGRRKLTENCRIDNEFNLHQSLELGVTNLVIHSSECDNLDRHKCNQTLHLLTTANRKRVYTLFWNGSKINVRLSWPNKMKKKNEGKRLESKQKHNQKYTKHLTFDCNDDGSKMFARVKIIHTLNHGRFQLYEIH